MADVLTFLFTAIVSLLKYKLVEAQDEDLENFFLSLQDCVTQIETAVTDNPRYIESLHDRLEGHVQIVFAISLVLASLQCFETLKEMLQNLLECLWNCLTIA